MTEGAPRRAYRSSLREEQAAQTRERVLDAAATLFLERGYDATSVAAIAQAAGVSPETVYARFGNKRTVLGDVVQRAVRGGDPAPVPEQEAPRALARETDPRRQLAAFADDIVARLQRAAPLVAVVAAAARGEPEAADLLRRLHEHRFANLGVLVDALARNAELPLGREAATETVWALTSPELFLLLTTQRGWSRQRYRDWLAASLASLLLAG